MSRFTSWRPVYVFALLSAGAATAFTNAVVDHGRWRIGFFVAPRFITRELAFGLALAVILIGTIDVDVLLLSNLRQVRGDGFPWRELWIVFVPAAIHEEIVFRGYVFQRLRAWNRPFTIFASSAVFAMLHGGNRGISATAMVNLILAGVLLALAYERYERLWFPIGIHIGWNVVSGPILGFDVSGYVPFHTVLRTIGNGSDWITGGTFGIEGSVVSFVVEAFAVAVLLRLNRMRPERSIT